MDNITLSKNQFQAILELVSQIGSNRNTVETKGTSDSRSWYNRYDQGSNEYYRPVCDHSDEQDPHHRNQLAGLNKSNDKFTGHDELVRASEPVFWKTTNTGRSRSPKTANNETDYYPYLQGSLVKATSIGSLGSVAQSCSSSTNREMSASALSLTSKVSGLSATPSFRRYARSVTSIEGEINWEERRAKMLKYRAELAAQKEEKERRQREEQERLRQEEEIAEKKMMEVQRRLQEEYEMERRLITEKREASERRRLAVVAAIEQVDSERNSSRRQVRGFPSSNMSMTLSEMNYPRTMIAVAPHRSSHAEVSTQTENNVSIRPSVAVQTDVGLLFDLIRSLGLSPPETRDEVRTRLSDISPNRKLYGLSHPNSPSKSRPATRSSISTVKGRIVRTERSNVLPIRSASQRNLTKTGHTDDRLNPFESDEKEEYRLTLSSSSSNVSLVGLNHNSNSNRKAKSSGFRRKSSSKDRPNLPNISSTSDSIRINGRKKWQKPTLEGVF